MEHRLSNFSYASLFSPSSLSFPVRPWLGGVFGYNIVLGHDGVLQQLGQVDLPFPCGSVLGDVPCSYCWLPQFLIGLLVVIIIITRLKGMASNTTSASAAGRQEGSKNGWLAGWSWNANYQLKRGQTMITIIIRLICNEFWIAFSHW